MKLSQRISHGNAGFTLVEIMVSSALYVTLVVGVTIALMIFGLRMYALSGTKLSASEGAMKVLNQIRNDIRASREEYVGNLSTAGDPTTFTYDATNAGSYITGLALKLYPTTNTVTPFYIYYLDTSGGTNYLRKYVNDGVNTPTNFTLSAYVTNVVVFSEEDSFGNLQTNYVNNRITRLELDFYQWEYPVGIIGGSNINCYDYFRVTTRISRRMID